MGRWSWYRSLDRPYNSFGTPNFVLAKPRKCHPTVSVTCADGGCLRVGFLTDQGTSAPCDLHTCTCTCIYVHCFQWLLLPFCPMHFMCMEINDGDKCSSCGVIQHCPSKLTSSPNEPMKSCRYYHVSRIVRTYLEIPYRFGHTIPLRVIRFASVSPWHSRNSEVLPHDTESTLICRTREIGLHSCTQQHRLQWIRRQ